MRNEFLICDRSGCEKNWLADMSGKSWTVAIRRDIQCERPDGTPIRVPAGLYTLRELGFARYELVSGGSPCAIVRFGELRIYHREGALDIRGRWP
jgi:hypothetical protein